MDSYIVRIYRRTAVDDKHVDSRALVGIVESPDGTTHHPFHDPQELWAILLCRAAPETATPPRGNKAPNK